MDGGESDSSPGGSQVEVTANEDLATENALSESGKISSVYGYKQHQKVSNNIRP